MKKVKSKIDLTTIQTCIFCQRRFDATKRRHGTKTICTYCGCKQDLRKDLQKPPTYKYFPVFCYSTGEQAGFKDFSVNFCRAQDLNWVNAYKDSLQWQLSTEDLIKVWTRNNDSEDKTNYGIPMYFQKAVWDLDEDLIVSLPERLVPDITEDFVLKGFITV